MLNTSRASIVVAVLLAFPAIAIACIWDYDTLRQERERFPTTLELITGKFLRHSKEFYEWRIKDRIAKLAADSSNLAYYDDLAVAYEMTGQHARALETILTKEKLKPGLYETHSNLGTFHILTGDFEQGLPHIDKALTINPNAHFGREIYQKWLVEYAIEKRRNGKLILPLQSSQEERERDSGRVSGGFQEFVKQRLGKSVMTEADLQPAVQGVLGMMRFANHANPMLLEALGDLLSHGRPDVDAKRLASRAYLRASYEVRDPSAQQQFRALAEAAIHMQASHTLADLEAEFRGELADAETWFGELRNKEIKWIEEGKDVEAEFDCLYTLEPSVGGNWFDSALPFLLIGVGILIVIIVATTVAVVFYLKRPARRSAP